MFPNQGKDGGDIYDTDIRVVVPERQIAPDRRVVQAIWPDGAFLYAAEIPGLAQAARPDRIMNPRLRGRLGWLPIGFHELALVVAVVVVVILTTLLDSNHSYWQDPGENFANIARSTAMLGIFSLGAAVVIIAGGIDLSAGSMIAFSGTICATLMVLMAPEAMANSTPLGTGVIVLAILGTLFVGFLVGTLHAWLIAIVRLPPFIATLGTLVGLRSLARVICSQVTESVLHARNSQIVITDEHFRELAIQVRNPIMIFLVLAVVIVADDEPHGRRAAHLCSGRKRTSGPAERHPNRAREMAGLLHRRR